MNRLIVGILLILMMFGHNYVLNQPQVLQQQFQAIHKISVPQFNLLYSIPSFISIFFILPLGVLYDKYSGIILIGAAFSLMFGQLLVSIFGASTSSGAFTLLTLGRVFEGTAAQLLYMIQANLSSSWMGKLAGLTLILPQVGQIANVFLTLKLKQISGVKISLYFGFFTCLLSFIACLILYKQIIKYKNIKNLQYQIKQNEKQQQPSEITEIKNSQSNRQQLQQQFQNNQENYSELDGPNPKICNANRIFWLVVILCAINQCLYFPFLDNAKVLIQTRFCIPQQKTSFYLCLPYLSAIIISFLVGQHMLQKYSRPKLIFMSSLLPLLGHMIIFFINNCSEGQATFIEEILLILGFVLFGSGIAGYYSVSMPAVGLAVPQKIRGTAFAILGFMQTLTMTIVPLVSGFIIEQDQDNYRKGYTDSSLFFVCLSLTASCVSFYIMLKSKPSSFKYTSQLILDNSKKQGSFAVSLS